VLAATEGEEAIRSDYTTDGAIHVLVNRTGPNTLRVLVRGSVDVLFYTLVRFDGFHAGRDGQLRAMDRAEYDAVEWGESPEELAVGPRDSRAIE
jgi:hypothetical protein